VSLLLTRLILLQKGRLHEDEAHFYAAEIVDMLEYLHGVGVIHRDVKVRKSNGVGHICLCGIVFHMDYLNLSGRQFAAYLLWPHQDC
jgi:serine/threonine protein kinase